LKTLSGLLGVYFRSTDLVRVENRDLLPYELLDRHDSFIVMVTTPGGETKLFALGEKQLGVSVSRSRSKVQKHSDFSEEYRDYRLRVHRLRCIEVVEGCEHTSYLQGVE